MTIKRTTKEFIIIWTSLIASKNVFFSSKSLSRKIFRRIEGRSELKLVEVGTIVQEWFWPSTRAGDAASDGAMSLLSSDPIGTKITSCL